jgi:diguanylate cyclase (GGDEF)-like protein
MAEKIVLDEWKKAASLDPLTELLNRRFIETKLQASIEELRRHGMTFGIIFCDIDRFKEINDTYGHIIGDAVLQMVAKTLSENVRAYDLAARWGGEEFLLVISHVTGNTLIRIADKLRTLVKNSFVERDGRDISVSVTMGATMAGPDDTIESLVERADGFMYAGKMSGRDCVVHDGQNVDQQT